MRTHYHNYFGTKMLVGRDGTHCALAGCAEQDLRCSCCCKQRLAAARRLAAASWRGCCMMLAWAARAHPVLPCQAVRCILVVCCILVVVGLIMMLLLVVVVVVASWW